MGLSISGEIIEEMADTIKDEIQRACPGEGS